MKSLIAMMCVLIGAVAATTDAKDPDGTRLLIEALVQVDEVENLEISRLPPRFLMSWVANINDISDTTAITAQEHEARLHALQPVIQSLIEATKAEPGLFDVSMLPEDQHRALLAGARRRAVRLLLADAERMMLAGSFESATDRVVAALGIVGVSLRDAESGGFIDRPSEPFVGHLIAENMLEMARETLCWLVPHLSEHDRGRIATALRELEEARDIAEADMPRWCTISLFDWMTTYEGLFRWSWTQSSARLLDTVWTAFVDDDTESALGIQEQLLDVARLHPLTRRLFWPGVGQMYDSARIDDDTTASLCRYAHALIRGESGAFGFAVQHDVDVFRRLVENWFTLSDHIACMQSLLSEHPKVPLDPIQREPTAFATFRAALNAYSGSAADGSIEATKRAALFAVILRDFVRYRDAEPGDEAERLAMLRDLEDLRPDDPLRFEAISRRVTERMFLDMHEQIETNWTTREHFLEHAPDWYASRGVPQAAIGVQQVIDSIDADADLQSRLHELARGWLASEMSQHGYGEIRKLRYPAEEAPQRWEDDGIDEYLLHYRGPMAVYLARDWFDDLVDVQEGTRALWELRDLLKANHKEN